MSETPAKGETEALLATLIRRNLLSTDEIIEAIHATVRTFLADQQIAQAELLQDLKRKIIAMSHARR